MQPHPLRGACTRYTVRHHPVWIIGDPSPGAVDGVAEKRLSPPAGQWRSQKRPADYLKRQHVVGSTNKYPTAYTLPRGVLGSALAWPTHADRKGCHHTGPPTANPRIAWKTKQKIKWSARTQSALIAAGTAAAPGLGLGAARGTRGQRLHERTVPL